MHMPVIKTSLGLLSGIDKEDMTEFRGLPYAQPAEGEWRLRAPRPMQPWQGVLACERHAGAAWQESNALLGVADQSLDCLRLNIWAPKSTAPLPVMVWFHGGGYVNGSPSQLLYQGERLARQQQVIVVNVGYRLGALGFGDFTDCLPGTDTNLGLRDQLAALEWVHEHIADLGGDPGQVTIFGESAGGFSVACLLACEQATGLFQRAIMQSGAGDMVVSPDESRRISAAFVEELGGAGQLLDADQKSWVKAQRASYRMTIQRGLRDTTPQYAMTWLPQVDGDLLADLPVNHIAKGSARDKHLLASVCRDEWNLFQYALPFNGNTTIDRLRGLTETDVRHKFHRALLPDDAEKAFALYSALPFHPQRGCLDWYAALESDRLFIAPTSRVLDAQVAAGGQAHAALFTHETTMFGVPLGACHVSDIPFVFDLTDKPVGQLFTGGGEDASVLAKEVQSVWGDIAHGRTPDWPEWRNNRKARVFGPGEKLQALMTAEREAFWQTLL